MKPEKEKAALTRGELLSHFQNEWLHRHSHFWKILSSMFIINTVITSFPICSSYFNVDLSRYKINLRVFPAIGIVFSIICFILLLAEAKKLLNLRQKIDEQLLKTGNKSKNENSSLSRCFNYFVASLLFFSMICFSIYLIIVL